jgi:hypothetical protein
MDSEEDLGILSVYPTHQTDESVPRWCSCTVSKCEFGVGIERVFFSDGKQYDTLKKSTMDKTLESTLKASINTMLTTCDDKGVFNDDDDTYRNTSSLQCQEVGRRKGAKKLVVIWAYSVALSDVFDL